MNLNQITVLTNNIETLIPFYEQLGLELIVKSLPHYARFKLPTGDATFSLHASDTVSDQSKVWIYFELDDLDAKVKQLEQQGLVFELMPKDQPWLWREAHLRDPDNNLIILYHAGVNRLAPPWRLK